MTQTPVGAAAVSFTAPRRTADLRRASRRLAALVLPIGPTAVALLRFVMPYDTTDSGTDIVRQVAEHQVRANLVVWLGSAAVLTLVPAALWVGRVTARWAPGLTAAAVLLLVPAYLSLPFLVSSDANRAVRRAPRPADLERRRHVADVHPVAVVGGFLFVLGHVVGTILLGVAMIRSGPVASWPAWRPCSPSRCTSSPRSSSAATPWT
jgi:hypothetical protein